MKTSYDDGAPIDPTHPKTHTDKMLFYSWWLLSWDLVVFSSRLLISNISNPKRDGGQNSSQFYDSTGWWFGTWFIFPYIGNHHPNWLSYFSEGWNHQSVYDSILWLSGNPLFRYVLFVTTSGFLTLDGGNGHRTNTFSPLASRTAKSVRNSVEEV